MCDAGARPRRVRIERSVARRPPWPVEGDESSDLATSEIGRNASPAWGTAPGSAKRRVLPPRDGRTISVAWPSFPNLDQGSPREDRFSRETPGTWRRPGERSAHVPHAAVVNAW